MGRVDLVSRLAATRSGYIGLRVRNRISAALQVLRAGRVHPRFRLAEKAMVTVGTRRDLLLLHVCPLVHRRAFLDQLLMHHLRQARPAVLAVTATHRRVALPSPRSAFARARIARRRPIDVFQDRAAVLHILATRDSIRPI